MALGYTICLIASVGLLIAYLLMVKKKEFWLTMLYISISVVNLGYLLMTQAKTVELAVLANDVAYFGSVFLSACMFLTIVRLCGFKITRAHVISCVSVAVVMLAVITSSPMLPLYYKSVSIVMIDGAAKLVKEYGPLHNAYLVYLLGYFALMIGTIVHSIRRKKMGNPRLAGFIAAVVCSNITVWLFEKLVNWEYEFLSVTYIISEMLLLCVYWMMQDYVLKSELPTLSPEEKEELGIGVLSIPMSVKIDKVLSLVKSGESLSPREREILELILDNKRRREIAECLFLSENTVKTYTRTLYAKLGVTRREELYALLLQE